MNVDLTFDCPHCHHECVEPMNRLKLEGAVFIDIDRRGSVIRCAKCKQEVVLRVFTHSDNEMTSTCVERIKTIQAVLDGIPY